MSYCLNPDCQKPQNPNGTKFCQSCGTKFLLAERYRAIKPLAQGGFGRTLLAEDEYNPSKPHCVIKQFYRQGQNNAGKAAELFQQEAVRLEQLGKHPQIPELFAHFEQDNRHYIVQEFIACYTPVKLWDVNTWKEKHILDYGAKFATFSPDGQTIATGGQGGNIILWDVNTGREIGILKEHSSSVESVAFSRDGKTLVSGCFDKTIKIWRVTR